MKCEICNENKTVVVHGLIDNPVELPCNCMCDKPKSNKIPFEWELIKRSPDGCSFIYRSKVFGGWIINTYTLTRDSNPCESMAFIPDTNHEWEV